MEELGNLVMMFILLLFSILCLLVITAGIVGLTFKTIAWIKRGARFDEPTGTYTVSSSTTVITKGT